MWDYVFHLRKTNKIQVKRLYNFFARFISFDSDSFQIEKCREKELNLRFAF